MKARKCFLIFVFLILLVVAVSAKELVFEDNVFKIGVYMINGSGLWNISDGGIKLVPEDATLGLQIPSLTNCDTIDTDGDGVFSCGADATGAGEDPDKWLRENTTDYLGGLNISVFTLINDSIIFSWNTTWRDEGLSVGDTSNLDIVNTSMLNNDTVLRTNNISIIRESLWDWANNATFVLDNGSVLRTGNMSDISLYINQTSNISLYLLKVDIADTSNLGIVNTSMLDNNTIIRTHNTTWIDTFVQSMSWFSTFWNRGNTSDYFGGENISTFILINDSLIFSWNTTWRDEAIGGDTTNLDIVNTSMLVNGSVLRTGNMTDIHLSSWKIINMTNRIPTCSGTDKIRSTDGLALTCDSDVDTTIDTDDMDIVNMSILMNDSTIFVWNTTWRDEGTGGAGDTSNLDIVNTSMLENGSVLRAGNLSDISLYINETSNASLYLLISDIADTTNLDIVNTSMLDNDTVIRTHNLTWRDDGDYDESNLTGDTSGWDKSEADEFTDTNTSYSLTNRTSDNISMDGGKLWLNISCVTITGSADLCDGVDDTAAGGMSTTAMHFTNISSYLGSGDNYSLLRTGNMTDIHLSSWKILNMTDRIPTCSGTDKIRSTDGLALTCDSDVDTTIDTDDMDIVNTSMLENGSVLRTGNLSNIKITILNVTQNITIATNLTFTNLINCDVLATDANGVPYCDADATGAIEEAWGNAVVNITMLDNNTIIRVGNVTNIMIGNTSWAIKTVNDSIKDYYNHSIENLHLLAPLDSPTFTTAFTATGLIGDEDLQSEDFGEFTCAGEDACTIDSGVIDADNIGADAVSDSELDGGFSWTLDADLNIDSNTLFIDFTKDLVGIGTITPSSTLEVSGNLTVTGATNSTINDLGILLFNSSCRGIRFGATAGGLFSCMP